MKHKLILTVAIALAIFATTSCFSEEPGTAPANPTTTPANPTQVPGQPTTTPANPPAPNPTQPPAVSGSTKLGSRSFPAGSVIFHSNRWSSGQPDDSDPYVVIYDPSQSGVVGRNPLGWWYQPLLPSANQRQAHEVALILQPGSYEFTGPSCSAWLNADGNSPFDRGRLIVDHANGVFDVAATTGKNESWVFSRCDAGAASGFSFSRIK